jgi:hypothetical protein
LLSFRRLIADILDLLVAAALAIALSNTGVGTYFASRAVVMLRIGAPDTLWKGPIPMMMGIAGTFIYALPIAILFVQLCEGAVGTSLGKAMLGVTIGPTANGMVSRRHAWRRAVIKSTPCWGLTLALLAGSWMLALVFAIVAVAMLGNFALALVTSTRPVHDAWSGTRVIRTHRASL